jgi:hypothetical protein
MQQTKKAKAKVKNPRRLEIWVRKTQPSGALVVVLGIEGESKDKRTVILRACQMGDQGIDYFIPHRAQKSRVGLVDFLKHFYFEGEVFQAHALDKKDQGSNWKK